MYQNCYGGMPVQQNPYYNTANQSPANLKFVNSQNDIMPNDIPMNGTPGIFPLKDQSGIIMKQWTSDGTIQTIIFRPDTDPIEPIEDPNTEKLREILESVRSLNKTLEAHLRKEAVG